MLAVLKHACDLIDEKMTARNARGQNERTYMKFEFRTVYAKFENYLCNPIAPKIVH